MYILGLWFSLGDQAFFNIKTLTFPVTECKTYNYPVKTFLFSKKCDHLK